MEYDAVHLPERVLEGCDKGSWIVRNARFRSAVCDYFQLRWLSCYTNGNCFFESACMLLHSLSIRPDLTAAQLRADVVQYLRLCPGSTQDLPERICIEMSDELSVPLVCSTRGRLNDTRLDGFVPTSIPEYLDASACDGVWVRGMHWLRAISFLHDVRVAVVINAHPIVRYIGAGEKTIHFYKYDAETHWDPLLPVDDASLPLSHEDKTSGTYRPTFTVYTQSLLHLIHIQELRERVTRTLNLAARMMTMPLKQEQTSQMWWIFHVSGCESQQLNFRQQTPAVRVAVRVRVISQVHIHIHIHSFADDSAVYTLHTTLTLTMDSSIR